MSTTVSNPLINCQPDQPDTAARVKAGMQYTVRTLRLWGARIRERHAFPTLSERDLRDLRLTRWDVERELAKPFWRG